MILGEGLDRRELTKIVLEKMDLQPAIMHLHAGFRDHLNAVLDEIFGEERELDEEPRTAQERIIHFLQGNSTELTTWLKANFVDGGEAGKEPAHNVIRFLMNKRVFPEIAPEIIFADPNELVHFFSEHFVKGLNPIYSNTCFRSRNFKIAGTEVPLPETSRSPNCLYLVDLWLAHRRNLKFPVALNEVVAGFHNFVLTLERKKSGLLAEPEAAQAGEYLYNSLTDGGFDGEAVPIVQVEDYEAIITRAVHKLRRSCEQEAPQSTDLIFDLGDFGILSKGIQDHLKVMYVTRGFDARHHRMVRCTRSMPDFNSTTHDYNELPAEKGFWLFKHYPKQEYADRVLETCQSEMPEDVEAFFEFIGRCVELHHVGDLLRVDEDTRLWRQGTALQRVAESFAPVWREDAIRHKAGLSIKDGVVIATYRYDRRHGEVRTISNMTF